MWKPLSLRKNCTIVTTRARKRWGRKRGWRESRSSPALLDRTCFARQDKRRHTSAKGVVDGENQRCASLRSLPDTCLLCASPYRLPTIECLLSHPPSLFGKTRRIVAQYSR